MIGDIEKLFGGLSENPDADTGGMVRAVPTGKVLDEDETHIEVMYNHQSYYAKPCMPFGSYSVPNKEWLEKYKDEILIWCSFENGNPAHLIYMGVCPKDEVPPKRADWLRSNFWKSVHFDYTFNDAKEEFEVRKKDDSEGFIRGVKLDKKVAKIYDKEGNMFCLNEGGKVEIVSSKGQKITLSKQTILGLGTGVFSVTMAEPLDAVLSTIIGTLAGAGLILPPQVPALMAQIKLMYSKSVKID